MMYNVFVQERRTKLLQMILYIPLVILCMFVVLNKQVNTIVFYCYTLCFYVITREITISIIVIIVNFFIWLFGKAYLKYTDSVMIIIVTFSMIRYFKYIHGLRTIWKALLIGFPDGITIFLIMTNFVIAFAFAFNIVYGSTLYGYETFSFSLQHVLTIFFGCFDKDYIIADQYTVSYFIWPTMVVMLVIILQNVYIAIFANAFTKASEPKPIDKYLVFEPQRSLMTYIRLYLGLMVGNTELTPEISDPVGIEVIKNYVNSDYDINIVVRDIYEQYYKTLDEPCEVLVDIDAFYQKFASMEIEKIKSVAYAPLYLAMYVITILYCYQIVDTQTEITKSNIIKGITVDEYAFTHVIRKPPNVTECFHLNGSYYNIDDSIAVYKTFDYESGIYMYLMTAIYIFVGCFRRDGHVLFSSIISLILIILRASVSYCNVGIVKSWSGLSIIVQSFGIIMIFYTNRRVRVLYAMMKHAYHRLYSIIVTCMLILIAYAVSGYLLLDYDNVIDPFFTFFNIFVNGFSNYTRDFNKENTFAIVWYITFVLFGSFIMYNMVVAVLTDAYSHVSKTIYNTHKAKKKLGINFRIPYEFIVYNNMNAYKFYCTIGHQPFRKSCTNSYLIKHFGIYTDEIYNSIVLPLVEIYGDYAENEIWLRALEIHHLKTHK